MIFNTNHSVGRRINRIAFVSGICFFVFAVVAVVSIYMVNDDLKSFIDNEYRIVSMRGDLMKANQGTGRDLCKMILASMDKDKAGVEQYYQDALTDLGSMEAGVKKLTKAESVDQELVRASMEQMGDFRKMIEQIHELCLQGRGMEAWAIYKTDYAPAFTQMSESLVTVLDNVDESADLHIEHTTLLTNIMCVAAVVIGLLLLIVMIFVTRRTTKSILVPLKKLEIASGNMREGRLNVAIDYDADDELGALCENFGKTAKIMSASVREVAGFAEAINQGKLDYQQKVEFVGDFKAIGDSLTQLSDTLSDDIRKIAVGAEQVNADAKQMTRVGQSLSQASVEQASSIQEVAATINSVSEHIAENASTANEVRESANTLYANMTDYTLIMQDVNKSLEETRAMTDKIRGIVKNLENISFQTNILALNAAVEAARAGEAGRGFAVIAGEIRELATEASRANTETGIQLNNMIEKILSSADSAAKAIGSLKVIREESKQTADFVDKITRASNDQATAIAQVRQSMNEITENIQSISSTAEESAASAEELLSQMKMLNDMVDSFELRKDD